MAMRLYNDDDIADIAAAIRFKNGTQTQYKAREMGDAVRASGQAATFAKLNVRSCELVDGYLKITFPVDCSRILSFGLNVEYDDDSDFGNVSCVSNASAFSCSTAYFLADYPYLTKYTVSFNLSGKVATSTTRVTTNTSPIKDSAPPLVGTYGHCIYV